MLATETAMRHEAPDGEVYEPPARAGAAPYEFVVIARRRYPSDPLGPGSVVAWSRSERGAEMRARSFPADPGAWVEPINGGGRS